MYKKYNIGDIYTANNGTEYEIIEDIPSVKKGQKKI